MSRFVALDLGAESGRVNIGTIENDRLIVAEAYRFPNSAVRVGRSLLWDPLYLFNEMKNGLTRISHTYGGDITSLAIDAWGIDFALLDRVGNLIGNPYSYRDSRTQGMMEEAFKRIAKREIYEQSGGIQFMSINSLYQMFSMILHRSPQLEIATTFLMIPDLFNYWFTGRKVCEFTDATSTQFYNSLADEWALDVLKRLGIPDNIYPEVVPPGTILGPLLSEIADEVHFGSVNVVAPASHDTASAVVGVPAEDNDFAWLSSGTWSLLGGISDRPLITPDALSFNISSYGGSAGTFLPWKNIMGLWLIQECRRRWERTGIKLTYDDITRMAIEASPFKAIIDPDHYSLLTPSDMPTAIQRRCYDTGQPVPEDKGEIVRIALEALTLKYRWVLEKLEIVLNREFKVLHIVGGGSNNRLLCQFTADALQLPVIAGPIEATTIGNIIVQARANGQLSSLDEARQLIRRSCEVVTYEPNTCDGRKWDRAYTQYIELLQKGVM